MEKELVWSLVSSLYSLVLSVVSGVVHPWWLIRTILVRSELKSYPVNQTYGFDKKRAGWNSKEQGHCRYGTSRHSKPFLYRKIQNGGKPNGINVSLTRSKRLTFYRQKRYRPLYCDLCRKDVVHQIQLRNTSIVSTVSTEHWWSLRIIQRWFQVVGRGFCLQRLRVF